MSEERQAAKVRIGTWNTNWAVPNRARGRLVSGILAEAQCDVLCVTEGSAGLLPRQDHIIDAGEDWGYPLRNKDRRKVLLWSRHPWDEKDCFSSAGFPEGRIVKGVTETPIGPLTVIGVCIPWRDAHVNGGRKDRTRWQDHQIWLEAFERLPCRNVTERTVVLGDFNQRIPRCGAPIRVYEALRRAFATFEIPTAGALPGDPGLAIDHIAHTPDLERTDSFAIWPRRNSDDESLSDHFGVRTDFRLAATT